MNKKQSYQYIWNVSENKVFLIDGVVSPYLETNTDFLNDNFEDGSNVINVNPYIRFEYIFSDFLNKYNLMENKDVVEGIKNSIVHNSILFLQKLDFFTGTTIVDVYCEKILKDLESKFYGKEVFKNIKKLSAKNKKILTILIYNNIIMNTDKMDTFGLAIKIFFQDSVIYKKEKNKIIIYANYLKNNENIAIIKLLKELFLKMEYNLKCYWNNHFGVIGVNEVNKLGEMALF